MSSTNLAARLERRLVRGEPDACWLWQGAVNAYGYGVITAHGRPMVGVHRVAFELASGRRPKLSVLHRCESRYAPGDITYRRCCNPAHLYEGTQRENGRDLRVSGRSTKGRRFPGVMARGEEAGPSKLTEAEVRAIRAACEAGETQGAVGARFGVGQMTVSDLVRRKTWAHITE